MFRNKLIKLLGGFTEEDVQRVKQRYTFSNDDPAIILRDIYEGLDPSYGSYLRMETWGKGPENFIYDNIIHMHDHEEGTEANLRIGDNLHNAFSRAFKFLYPEE